MKRILFFFCLVLAIKASAGINPAHTHRDSLNQDSIHRPYNAWGHYQTWGIKFKVLPFFGLGNSAGFNALLGFEYGFCKNHSIGIDVYFLAMEYSNDMVNDTTGVQHDVGNDHYTRDRALFINYRYYLPLQNPWHNPLCSYYIGCFGRYGRQTDIFDPLFKRNYVSSEEVHYSAGILLGMLKRFQEYKHFGFDVNIGLFYKERDLTDITNRNGTLYTTVTRPDNIGFRIGLNLYLMNDQKARKS